MDFTSATVSAFGNPVAGLMLLAILVIAHFVCDFPLQGDFLSTAKNHKTPIPGVPWQWASVAHASIHGGAVWLITGYWILGLAEFCCHAAIDWLKCNKSIDFSVDQILHIIMKLVWVLLIVNVLP